MLCTHWLTDTGEIYSLDEGILQYAIVSIKLFGQYHKSFKYRFSVLIARVS